MAIHVSFAHFSMLILNNFDCNLSYNQTQPIKDCVQKKLSNQIVLFYKYLRIDIEKHSISLSVGG